MAINFNDTQAAALLGPLGLTDPNTDPDTVVATVKDALAADVSHATPSAIVAAVAAAGLGEVVDSDTLTSLRHDAAEGRQLKAVVERERIENTVATAISKGKITPGRKDHWVNLITADPGMADVLASVPDETAVPLTAIGHGIASEDTSAVQSDEWFY